MSSYRGGMFRGYLLKRGFWSIKGNQKILLKHDIKIGAIYAKICNIQEKKGVELTVNNKIRVFFNNFDDLETFFHQLDNHESLFSKILRRKEMSQQLRKLKL